MNNAPQTLKGFRDFLPEEKRKRDFVMGKIIEVFENFGFEPLETPTLEYASLLTGKYGKEADKLLYTFKDRGDREVGLRFDQTVPTARVLSQYRDKLPKYFRRYQTQNVFRADKPQKGRYREFTQCDIDIFGSTSPISDAEIVACTYLAYKNIGFEKVIIKINDRQTLLSTLGPFAKDKIDVFSIIQTIDKMDKIGQPKVIIELTKKGLNETEAKTIVETITNSSQTSDNLQQIIKQSISLGVPEEAIQPDTTLARGLDYYTGMIFEVVIPDYLVGSVGGGGRYDNLINELGGIDIPAVGMAFGFDRTVEAADQFGLIPSDNLGAKVLVTIFPDFEDQSLKSAQILRNADIKTEVFPTEEKLGKQFKYANKKGIPFVLVIGENEVKNDKVTLKNMDSGDQQILPINDVIELLTNNNLD